MSIAEKLTTIAENEQKVYDKGVADGRAAYSKTWWAEYLMNGGILDGDYLFAGQGWKNTVFYPPYNIYPTRANYMFALSGIKGDLVELLAKTGKTIDFKNCTMMHQTFTNANSITRIGVVDLSKMTYGGNTFQQCSGLVTIDEVILSSKSAYTNYLFYQDTKLKNLTISGVIAKNNFSVQWSNELTYDSLVSIKNALEDKSSDTSGTSWVITVGSTNKAKYTDADLEEIRAKGWTVK